MLRVGGALVVTARAVAPHAQHQQSSQLPVPYIYLIIYITLYNLATRTMPRCVPRAWRRAVATPLPASLTATRLRTSQQPTSARRLLRVCRHSERLSRGRRGHASSCPARRWFASGGATFQAFPMGLYEQPPPGGTADPVRARAGDAPRLLTAAQIRDTTRLLRPEAVRYAPALGLLMFNAMPFVSNIRWCETFVTAMGHDRALANACILAEELFFQRSRSQPLALTRSRSRVAYYLTPSLLGHVLGLASATPPLSDKQLNEALRNLGITTNKVNGVKTGVSLARWRRVIRLAEPVASSSNNDYDELAEGIGGQLAIAMLLRVLWERASTKACLATFLTTLDTYTPVLRPADECSHVKSIRQQHAIDVAAAETGTGVLWRTWLRSGFNADELGASDDIEQAALTLLRLPAAPTITNDNGNDKIDSSSDGWEEWAAALDRVAASLSQVQVAKPRLTVTKYGYQGLPEKPDCVEVTCREILDLLLYDPLKQVCAIHRRTWQ